jgi:hypothetical protein
MVNRTWNLFIVYCGAILLFGTVLSATEVAMDKPFGGPPAGDVWEDVWNAGPYGYLLGANKFAPKPFGDWLEGLPESENIEDRRDPNYKPPDRGHTISKSIGEWPEYKEPPAKQEKASKRDPKTPAEWAEFYRAMDTFAAYGRR